MLWWLSRLGCTSASHKFDLALYVRYMTFILTSDCLFGRCCSLMQDLYENNIRWHLSPLPPPYLCCSLSMWISNSAHTPDAVGAETLMLHCTIHSAGTGEHKDGKESQKKKKRLRLRKNNCFVKVTQRAKMCSTNTSQNQQFMNKAPLN